MAEKNGTPAAVRPPEGMARVGSVANAPWFHLEKGNVLHGTLVNMFDRPDERAKSGRSKFFQVQLLAPAKCRYGRGKQAKVNTAPVGQVVNLNYGPKTKEFEKFVPEIIKGAEFEIWCHVEDDKFEIGKGQTMWPIDVRAMQTKAVSIRDDEPDFDGVEDEADEPPAAGAPA